MKRIKPRTIEIVLERAAMPDRKVLIQIATGSVIIDFIDGTGAGYSNMVIPGTVKKLKVHKSYREIQEAKGD